MQEIDPELPEPTLAALEGFVRQGGGLLVTGGTQSFGPGGYLTTRLESMLPVRLDIPDRREEATLALALVIDRSGSMAGPKMELTKEAARATAEGLPPSDQIAVIVFDSAANPVVITTDKGILTVTGDNAAAGTISYSYQETGGADDHTAGDDSVKDNFTVTVTDVAGVSTSNDLVIQILDTAPVANDDAASVTEDATAPVTGTFVVTTTKATDPARYDLYLTAQVELMGDSELIVSRPIAFVVTERSQSANVASTR